MNKTVLNIAGLTKSYGRITAVRGLSISVNQGEVFGILGPNGSGKTTTLAIITGIIRPDTGTFTWFGEISHPSARKKIGSLIEIPNFYPYLSLHKNLQIIARIKGVSDKDIPRVLHITGLFERTNYRYDSLSLGMKQRLALAAVLLGDPQVLVLDEPANGLDPQGIAEVREIIKNEGQRNKTIILASHILDEVEKVCTHICILKEGEMIARGKVHELLSAEDTVIVSSENIDILEEELIRSGMTKTIHRDGSNLVLILNNNIKPGDINNFASQKGLVLTRLEIRKKSLESQFLELVKQTE